MECISESGFLPEVVLYLLPALITWFGFTYILKFAADWF
jgi:hypothetical protein